MIETLMNLFGISSLNLMNNPSQKFLRSLIFIADVFLLCFFAVFSATKISQSELDEISNSRSKKILLLCITGTAFVIIFQAWACRMFEDKTNEHLADFERCFSKGNEKKSSPKALSVIAARLVLVILQVACLILSVVPSVVYKLDGMWEILLYPVILIEFASFRYAKSVEQVGERFSAMRKELQQIIENEDKVELSGMTFRVYTDNAIQKKVELEKTFIKLSKCYNVMISAVSCFNIRFGFSVLCIIFSSFLSITYCGYNFFIEIETKMDIVIIIGEQKLMPELEFH